MIYRIDEDFIKNAQEFAAPFVKQNMEIRKNKINKWNEDNREKLRHTQKVYDKTEKGKKARKCVSKNRYQNMLKAQEGLSWEEKVLIGDFYKNCPKGYQVDHIIPLCKGGLHRLSNLQYLTKEDNAKKASKIL